MNDHTCWDSFDRFYCISVDRREDRRSMAEAQFQRVGLAGRVEFVLVAKHPTDPEQGIYESHMLCMRKGILAGASSIVIFEDDVIFDRFDPATLERGAAFLASNPDWKICHFGCMAKQSSRTGNRSVRKIRYRSLTHAYVIHRPFAERLSREPWRGIPYDDFLQTFREDTYIIQPCFAFQSDSPSDNDVRMNLETFRNFCGGLRRLQKMNEFYNCHRALIIALHVPVVLILLRWIF
jgi:GR25 family glycosyltransferase involved in LPS biosynthesis